MPCSSLICQPGDGEGSPPGPMSSDVARLLMKGQESTTERLAEGCGGGVPVIIMYVNIVNSAISANTRQSFPCYR